MLIWNYIFYRFEKCVMAKRRAAIKSQKVKACEVSCLITRKDNSKLSLKECSEKTRIRGTAMDMLIG